MTVISLRYIITDQINIFVLKSGVVYPKMFLEKNQYALTRFLPLFPFTLCFGGVFYVLIVILD